MVVYALLCSGYIQVTSKSTADRIKNIYYNIIMLNSTELYLLSKLLNRIKYSEFDQYEINEFADSPITNEILEKLNKYFSEKVAGTHLNQKNRKSKFEFDNDIGIAIRNRLKYLDENVLKVISKWNEAEKEKFALDIVGPIECDRIELDKLKNYISELR
jgi:hypothetical protein